MYERKIPINTTCGVEVAQLVIGGKWKSWLIRAINTGSHRPVDIQRAIPTATKRVLTQQLNELEEYGAVYKIVYAEVPMRVEYFLTELGESLIPLIKIMDDWGLKNIGTVLHQEKNLNPEELS
ncbi:helix-turn-helix domain-containing protein [Flavobacterium sp. Root186]|uniref:winged helix-turn-helix transcriptional regulator n=1 Tax=Flavobacterium sp. Root186 TaxID=1736485 RepID=UPI0006F3323C|nr:helix-turn-helix domain-containing protein [Flavobacterium sp. Root186]KRB55501.1 HxlR family transcriptional regulator [Flavobacterium sp. Root186]